MLVGPTPFKGQTSEFRRRALGVDPLPYLIALCPVCGFADLIGAFADAAVSDDLRVWIDAHLRPLMRDGLPPVSTRYVFAARIAAWQEKPEVAVGNLWMRAAWCADDEGTDDDAYRRAAADHFTAAVESSTPPENRLTLMYLIGELYRRVGETESARAWFERAIADASATPEPTAQRIIILARQQRDTPTETLS